MSQSTDSPKKRAPIGCIAILALPIILFASCSIMMATSGGGDDTSFLKNLAAVSCERQVKERLTNPDSARFPSSAVTNDGNVYSVAGEVRAENAFGGTVTSLYGCTVTMSGDEVSRVVVEYIN